MEKIIELYIRICTQLIAEEKLWKTVILRQFPSDFCFLKNTDPMEFAKQLSGIGGNLKNMYKKKYSTI